MHRPRPAQKPVVSCYHCGTADGPFFRQNEKGVVGIWACSQCTKHVEAEFKRLVDLIQEAANEGPPA